MSVLVQTRITAESFLQLLSLPIRFYGLLFSSKSVCFVLASGLTIGRPLEWLSPTILPALTLSCPFSFLLLDTYVKPFFSCRHHQSLFHPKARVAFWQKEGTSYRRTRLAHLRVGRSLPVAVAVKASLTEHDLVLHLCVIIYLRVCIGGDAQNRRKLAIDHNWSC